MREDKDTSVIGRRRFCVSMRSLGAFWLVAGCGDSTGESAGTDSEGGGTDAESTGSTGGTDDATGTTAGSSGSSGETTAGPDPSTGETSGETTGGFACEPSPMDIEGPFYRPGIPVGGDMDVHGDEGVPLILSGIVYGTDCAPVEGAIVELWHATPVLPDGQPGDFDAEYDNTEDYRYYGQVATGADGSYEFTTLRPGWYLNGPEYRPAHLHLKVWVEGEEVLTTQVYFAGDPFNEGDNWYNPEMEVDPGPDGQATLDLTVPPVWPSGASTGAR